MKFLVLLVLLLSVVFAEETAETFEQKEDEVEVAVDEVGDAVELDEVDHSGEHEDVLEF